jgi:hypothetical protein
VSVVVTNEQAAMNSDNITCDANISKQFAIENINDIFCPESVSQISNNKLGNSYELTHIYPNTMDIPSDVINLSGNHEALYTPQVIIKQHNKNRDNDSAIRVVDKISKSSDENINKVEPDAVAFTDETCDQYIDSEELVNKVESSSEHPQSLSTSYCANESTGGNEKELNTH